MGTRPLIPPHLKRYDYRRVRRLKAKLSAISFYQATGFQKNGNVFPSEKTGIPHTNMTLIINN